MSSFHDVIMIRHAQSTWNAQSRFTGWADPPLTELGISEAKKAAHTLKANGYHFDLAYTSVLQRAQQTAEIILRDLGAAHTPTEADWRLNERHYGSLQGLDKVQMTNEVGKEQVWRWRRGYTERPPQMPESEESHPSKDPKYKDLAPERIPSGESLADTRVRVVECWEEKIAPQVNNGKKVLLSAHGNTLRALIMYLDDMSPEEVEQFEIPTGTPILYRFDEAGKPVSWQYLSESAD